MAEKVQCPNCLEPAEKVGNKITCVACDSVLTVTRTGGAKALEIGWKEKLESRVDTLEGMLSPEEPEEIATELAAAAEADAAADAAADADEPILPR